MPTAPELVRDIYAAISAHDLDRFLRHIADDMVEHENIPLPPGGTDKERVGQWFAMIFAAFPDMSATVEDTVTESDKIVCRVRMRGTHQGVFMGAPATGRSVDFGVIDIHRIADGLVAEHWGLSDDLAMMQQLGLAPT